MVMAALLYSSLLCAAQDRDTLTLHFRVNETQVDLSYGDNARSWARFLEKNRNRCEEIDSRDIRMDIYAGASPEGPAARNRELGEGRGNAIAKLIREQFPCPVGSIVVHNQGARWEDFYQAVAAGDDPWKEEVLKILRQPASGDSHARDPREEKLRNLKGGTVWPELLEKYLSPLRSGGSAILSYQPKHDTLFFAAYVPADTVIIRDTIYVRDTVQVVPVVVEEPRVLAWKPIVAVGTNLLFDAALAPNLEVEFPFGYSRWSLMAEWWTPWYRWNGPGRHNRAYELLMGGLEARFWFSRRPRDTRPDVLKGHFVGVYAAGGIYDFEWDQPEHQGWQGEYYSAGLTYGYAFALGRNWRLTLSLSGGYVGGPQRYYKGMFEDEHLIWQRTRNFSYIGPTKLKVTLSYIIGWKTWQKGGDR